VADLSFRDFSTRRPDGQQPGLTSQAAFGHCDTGVKVTLMKRINS